jgi:glyoxylate reductase
MRKTKVFLTREIPKKGLDILANECELIINTENRSLTEDEIIENMRGTQGLISLLSDSINSKVIESNPDLKIISNYAVGYNNIDVDTATRLGIKVTNTPEILTETTADLTWALLLSVARRIVYSDKFLRDGKFKGWAPKLLLGTDIYGKTLGIIGFGRIGQAVAKRARGFNMKVYYYKRNPISKDEEKELCVEYKNFSDLIKISDYITINAPLNDDNYHMFSTEEFLQMKNSAILINAGRGPIVDENALVKALKSKDIAGAGLDVYEEEPLVNPALLELDNVVLTPHTGSATVETRDKMAVMVANDMLLGLRGERPLHIVNPEIYNK